MKPKKAPVLIENSMISPLIAGRTNKLNSKELIDIIVAPKFAINFEGINVKATIDINVIIDETFKNKSKPKNCIT